MSDDPVARRALVRAMARKLRAQQRAAKERDAHQKLKARKLRDKRSQLEFGEEFAHRMGREYAIKVGAVIDPEKERERALKSHFANRDARLAGMKAYYLANKERILDRKKAQRDKAKEIKTQTGAPCK